MGKEAALHLVFRHAWRVKEEEGGRRKKGERGFRVEWKERKRRRILKLSSLTAVRRKKKEGRKKFKGGVFVTRRGRRANDLPIKSARDLISHSTSYMEGREDKERV